MEVSDSETALWNCMYGGVGDLPVWELDESPSIERGGFWDKRWVRGLEGGEMRPAGCWFPRGGCALTLGGESTWPAFIRIPALRFRDARAKRISGIKALRLFYSTGFPGDCRGNL